MTIITTVTTIIIVICLKNKGRSRKYTLARETQKKKNILCIYAPCKYISTIFISRYLMCLTKKLLYSEIQNHIAYNTTKKCQTLKLDVTKTIYETKLKTQGALAIRKTVHKHCAVINEQMSFKSQNVQTATSITSTSVAKNL